MGRDDQPENCNPPQRKRLRLAGFDYSQGGGYFITINAVDRLPMFGRMQGQQVVLNEVGQLVHRLWGELPEHYPGVVLDSYIVIPNHLHGIVVLVDPKFINEEERPGQGPAPTPESITDPDKKQKERSDKPIDIPSLMARFKSLSTTQYYGIKDENPESRLPSKLWQRSYYERIIRSEDDLAEKRNYIATNPLRRYLNAQNH